MYRIDNATAATTIPTPGPIGPNPDGFFFGGNPSLGELATVVNADWLNSIQEEICAVVDAAGITLDKTVRTQLLQAIQFFVQNPPFANSTSAANSYVASLGAPPPAYFQGMLVIIRFTHGNTGAATLNLNALGAEAITYTTGAALTGGEIPDSGIGIFVFDGTNFQIINPIIKKFVLNKYYVTSTQAYTPSVGMSSVEFDVLGAGASGGGGVGAASAAGAGGGGAAGERRIGTYSASDIAAAMPITITIGVGGAVQAPAFDGVNGGDTSVGSLITAKGGGLGLHGISRAGVGASGGGQGGHGGTGGDINFPGQPGTASFTLGSEVSLSGCGGSTVYGAGGGGPITAAAIQSDGVPGTGYGSGGSGGATGSTTSVAGGAGMNGLVVVVEKCYI